MIDVTLQNFETEVIAASMTTARAGGLLGALVRALQGRSARSWKSWRSPTRGASSWSRSTPTTSSSWPAPLASRASPPACCCRAASRWTASWARCPRAKCASFLTSTCLASTNWQPWPTPQEAQQHLESGDIHAAQARLADALATNPGNDDIRYDYVKLLISTGQLAEAAASLAPGMAQIPVPLRFEALSQWLNAMEFAATDPRAAWSPAQFDQKIAENKRDFETRFARSRVLMAQGEWTAAMDELLEIIMRDKTVERVRPAQDFRGHPGTADPAQTQGRRYPAWQDRRGYRAGRQKRRAGRPASRAGFRLPAQAQHDAELKEAAPALVTAGAALALQVRPSAAAALPGTWRRFSRSPRAAGAAPAGSCPRVCR